MKICLLWMLEVCAPIQRNLNKLDKLSTGTSSAAMENIESIQDSNWSTRGKICLQEITNSLKLTLWRKYWVTESLWNFQKEEKVQEIWVKSILDSLPSEWKSLSEGYFQCTDWENTIKFDCKNVLSNCGLTFKLTPTVWLLNSLPPPWWINI